MSVEQMKSVTKQFTSFLLNKCEKHTPGKLPPFIATVGDGVAYVHFNNRNLHGEEHKLSIEVLPNKNYRFGITTGNQKIDKYRFKKVPYIKMFNGDDFGDVPYEIVKYLAKYSDKTVYGCGCDGSCDKGKCKCH